MHATPRPDSDTLVIEQQVRAKPGDVFADLTVPDRMVRWWGDRSKWWLTSAEVDLRPNGRFWVSWENTNGEKDGMGGHFKAIDRDQGFVLSFVGSHDKSHVDELAIRLDQEDARTKVTLRHSGLAGRPERYADYQRGWTLILGWLARQYGQD
jgi:uncharacterized protein YndB with AHSA1/START domain